VKKENSIQMKNTTKPLRVIHSSAPLRINDIGGWTDTWFAQDGFVLNQAVSPRVEVEIRVFENRENKKERVQVCAENYGATFWVDPGNPSYDTHPFIQGAIHSLTLPGEAALEITIRSQAPGGSAVGTSASVCVALLGGLGRLTQARHSPAEIVSLAHRVETEKLKLQSGVQDQICAAHGGICFIHVHRYPAFRVDRLVLDERNWRELDRRLSLIYLGRSHSSSALHDKVIAFLERKGARFAPLRKMSHLAQEAKDHLLRGDLEALGEAMSQNTECQRSLHPDLVSEEADQVIALARAHGAAGWKVNGAGGKGGSVTLLGSPEDGLRQRMLQEIDRLGKGIRSIPISLSLTGLEVRE
jgi:D-glycero-alpha-D-manno-heptose-7-phosphate kinase